MPLKADGDQQGAERSNMIFCGQCGLQLAPGSTRCPRCGAMVEEPQTAALTEELHSDDPTIASASIIGPLTQGQGQQPLVLGSGSTQNGYPSGTQAAYDATNMMEPPNYTQTQNQPYTGYPAQSGSAYPSTTTGAYQPPQGQYNEYGTMGGGNYQTGMVYPNGMQSQIGYQQMSGQYMQDEAEMARAAANARGRTTGLVLVLFGLILIFGAVILFAIQHHMIG